MNKLEEKEFEVVKSLDPFFNEHTKVMIIGTLPSSNAVLNNEYYTTNGTGNKFWKMIFEILDETDIDMNKTTYNDNLKILDKYHIGLWDIIKEAKIKMNKEDKSRRSNSDEDIIRNSVKFNDLSSLPKNVKFIIFNGRCYEGTTKVYKDIKEHLEKTSLEIEYCQSTSSNNFPKPNENHKKNWELAFKKAGII